MMGIIISLSAEVFEIVIRHLIAFHYSTDLQQFIFFNAHQL